MSKDFMEIVRNTEMCVCAWSKGGAIYEVCPEGTQSRNVKNRDIY